VADDYNLLPEAPVRRDLAAPRDGVIATLDARTVGETAVALGAGRERKEDAIDPAVGIVLHAKIGDPVAAGQPLLTIHARSDSSACDAADRLLAAYTFRDRPVAPPPLVYEVLRG